MIKRIVTTLSFLLPVLAFAMFLGISKGSTDSSLMDIFQNLPGLTEPGNMLYTIIWQIRFPRVLLAALTGAALSLGGLVFQALLRNPLAEPYILGISGGSAIGAIIGILLGFSRFPGVSLTAFAGSIATLLLILAMSYGQVVLKKDTLLLSGVMLNAFCAAIIMFLISMTRDSRLHNIIFWLMGDLSMGDMKHVAILAATLIPCFILVFWLSHPMNLLLMGKETALTLGISIKAISFTLLITTSFMISATVSYCGLVGFVGLVMPHLFRLVLGSDHRVLVPACIFGGGAYMIFCDLLARTLPKHGEMPAGVITAIIGAPLFIYLLKRSAK